MAVRLVGHEVHDAGDSLSDHGASSCIPLPHFIYSSGPCIRYVKVVYPAEKNGLAFESGAVKGSAYYGHYAQHLNVAETD